jgi:hypothetical protein
MCKRLPWGDDVDDAFAAPLVIVVMEFAVQQHDGDRQRGDEADEEKDRADQASIVQRALVAQALLQFWQP